jgi:DNA-directed RNA polymerase subunit RPC12/RpoP
MPGVRDLFVRGTAAAKAGDIDEARLYLQWALRQPLDDFRAAEVWYWLAEIDDDPVEKRRCLEESLVRNSLDPRARRSLAILDGRLNPDDIINPDQLPAPDDSVQAAAMRRFTCPRCDARKNYAAGEQTLRCDYCGYVEQLGGGGETAVVAEQDFLTTLALAKGHQRPEAVQSFQCQSCGVGFLLDPETISLTCPYCDAVYVIKESETQTLIPPQAIIPFAFEQEAAEALLRRWLQRRQLSRARLTPLVGFYLPAWDFTVSGEIQWSYLVEENQRMVTRVGRRYIMEEDLLIPAVAHRSPLIPKAADSFDLSQLATYDPRYLADWPAETYEIAVSDASLQARQKALIKMRQNSDSWLRGEEARNLTLRSGGMIVESYRLILLPVWLTHYNWEGRPYDIVINGQTGKLYGQRPSRSWRQWLREWFNLSD